MISASTSSATLRVLEKGALKTGMPRLRAHSRSTWLVPIQKQPMATVSGGAAKNVGGQVGGGTDADEKCALQRFREGVAGKRLGVRDDVGVPVAAQHSRGIGMHAFQQDDFDFALGEKWRP